MKIYFLLTFLVCPFSYNTITRNQSKNDKNIPKEGEKIKTN